MSNKLAAVVYWLVAGSWIFLGLAELIGSPFSRVKLWQIGIVGLCALALLLGLRWCAKSLRAKSRSS